jgi:dTDP-4-dehydrorhamnose reductase
MKGERLAHVLVIGAAGQLGGELMRALASCQPVGPARAELDLEDAGSVRAAMKRYRPTLVVNTAAFHKVEACETEVRQAFAVNAVAIDNLAAECARAGAVLAHVSTDYVFDGTKSAPYDEEDATLPLNVYGASKLAGEHLLRRHGERHFIFRTSGLFGRTGRSTKGVTFVERMLQMAERGETPKVVDDLVFSPSYAPHVAAAMREVVASDRFGVYHVTNSGQCTWYELAVEALRRSGSPIEVVATRSHSTNGARRPANSALAHGALLRNGFEDLPSWQTAVKEFVQQRTPAPARR